MKQILQILRVLSVIAAIFFTAVDACGYDFYDYEHSIFLKFNSDRTAVLVCDGNEQGFYHGGVVIPESVTYNDVTYPVTGIADNAFWLCKYLTSVSIPNTVTYIGESAFFECESLTSITIPISVTFIGEHAFAMCDKLQSVQFNAENCLNCGYGGYSVFRYGEVKSFTFGDKVKRIPDYCLAGLGFVQSVDIPSSVIAIGDYAFNKLYLQSVTIPNSVKEIGSHAFDGCRGLGFESITIPESVVTLGDYAFANCSDARAVTLLSRSITKLSDYLFSGCRSLRGFEVPEWVTSIGEGAFQGCNSIESMVIPGTVSSIGAHAFEGCSGMKSVTLPANTVTALGDYIFSGCGGLGKLVIPGSVTSIGSHAFDGCSGLGELTLPESVSSIGDNVIDGCTALRLVTFGKGLRSVGVSGIKPPKMMWLATTPPANYKNYGGCVNYVPNDKYSFDSGETYVYSGLESAFEIDGIVYAMNDNDENACDIINCSYAPGSMAIAISPAVTYGGKELKVSNIRPYAFYDNDAIKSLTIDFDGEIPANAFYGCGNIPEVVVPASVKNIGDKAFFGCSSIENITLGNAGTVGQYAFSGCSSAKSLTVAPAVTSIGDYAFQGCRSLSSVVLETGLDEITLGSNGDSSIFGDSPLVDAFIGRKLNYPVSSEAGYSPFYHKTSLRAVTLSDAETAVYDNEFNGCSGLETFVVPNSVKTIGSDAFNGCSGLTSVTIGNSVTNIGSNAFDGCERLKLAVVPNSVTAMGDGVFNGCNALHSLTLGSGLLLVGSSDVKPQKVIWLVNTPPVNYKGYTGDVNYVTNDNYSFDSGETFVYNYLSSKFEADGIVYVPVSPAERTCHIIDCKYPTEPLSIAVTSKTAYRGIEMSVLDMRPYAFYDNDAISTLTIDYDGTVPNRAFYGCDNITKVNVPESVKEVGDAAFFGCVALEEVELNNNGSVGESVFEGCPLITSAAINNNGSVGDKAFIDCAALESITLGNKGAVGQYAFSGCSGATSLTIAPTVTSIGDYAFNGCTGIANVVIEENADGQSSEITFGSNGDSPLFADCPLVEAFIGRDMSYSSSSDAGYSPFYRKTTLNSVEISDAVTAVCDNEFYGCSNLREVNIGDCVETYGNYSFSGCSSLNNFVFGSSVKSIGEEAFANCSAITSITSLNTVPPVCGSNALNDIDKWECTLHVPASYKEAYQKADQWKDFFFIEDDQTTGVESVIGDNGVTIAPVSRYDLNGNAVGEGYRGLTIVKYSDGSVRKEYYD